MNKEKTLILLEKDPTNLLSDEYAIKGYSFDFFFKDANVFLRAIRRVWLKYDLPYKTIWFGSWYHHLDLYDTLIINMNRLTRYTIETVSRKYPKMRIIGWYWNTIDETNKPICFADNVEYWSFDENDCKKYGFYQNIQYYSCIEDKGNVTKDTDVYFVGRAKDREEEILSFKRIADQYGLKQEMHIVHEGGELIPYSEVRKSLRRSLAVLEINKENQVGFTLRVMESLFYGIKLITNNRSIRDSEVYNENNIFIIGEDDDKKLVDFIHSPYDHQTDALRDRYSLQQWFNNFDQADLRGEK